MLPNLLPDWVALSGTGGDGTPVAARIPETAQPVVGLGGTSGDGRYQMSPVDAVVAMTAGPDGFRRPGPHQILGMVSLDFSRLLPVRRHNRSPHHVPSLASVTEQASAAYAGTACR